MWLTGQDLLVVTILVLAGLVRGALGFGDALLAMPLLMMILPARAASPLMALAALLLAIVILIREWRDVHIRSAVSLIGFGLIGIPFGVWILSTIDDRIVKAVLGVVVTAFAVWSLWKPNSFRFTHDKYAPFFGLAAGLLGGAYNTAGPPLVIYATLRQWPPERFRAMMQAYCLFGSAWIIVIHGVAGNITQHTLTLLATGAPFMILATVLGRRLTTGVATERFIRWVYGALILVGVWLLISCLPAFR